jgi:hypothetical protein
MSLQIREPKLFPSKAGQNEIWGGLIDAHLWHFISLIILISKSDLDIPINN